MLRLIKKIKRISKKKRTNLKGSVFKIFDESRDTVFKKKKAKKAEKSAKCFKCDHCDYKSEKLATLKNTRAY